MTYGVFQDYLVTKTTLHGSQSALGVVGTTSNGVMYLSMPILFATLSRRWAHLRRGAAIAGTVILTVSYLLSSFSTQVWHLIATQGVLAAFGSALLYSPTTLSLGENFSIDNRAVAYGVVLSSKNIAGTTCPFLLQYLLSHHGFRLTMQVWTALAAGLSFGCIFTMPMHAPGMESRTTYRSRKIPWDFLYHQTIWITAIATMLQSSGYGLPQTYLSSYASSVASLSVTSSTLLITLFNVPGIISSSFFGFLSDNKRFQLSATSTAFISAVSSAMAVFFFWGFSSASSHSMVFLVLFSVIYGFFAGGYSATWGGAIKEMEREAADKNEALDTGIVYGLLNGARGIGYVGGGLAGVQLLKIGAGHPLGRFGYGTSYGPLILYTGLSTFLGGWGIFFKWRKLLH
ncbi:MFS general substrate transporter [Myriangium duriaei CBS 260.36]|uniref:MFS general substrate transporter n=1 Tax=Myriangium duriaei CBS 260.36 TaxID=1168546 RepID=A0A9P4MS94_9PEZI|nr:MFS general substrate transporter [Myriangium duriaei CBS 260.36]